jgi:hypothetical protein
MEWWVIRHDFREEMEAWAIFHFLGVLQSPSRPSARKFAVEIVSVALIVFGIFGEIGIGLEIASINSQLRGKSAELRSKNADLREKSNQLVALLQKETEDERMARLQIVKSMEWRHLSEGAKKSLCRILSPQTANAVTFVVTVWEDPEPASYAKEFKDTIASCRPIPVPVGVNPHQAQGLSLPRWTFPMRFGVSLEFPSKYARMAAALLAALQANGVDAHIPLGNERLSPKAARWIVVLPRAHPDSGDTPNSDQSTNP